MLTASLALHYIVVVAVEESEEGHWGARLAPAHCSISTVLVGAVVVVVRGHTNCRLH